MRMYCWLKMSKSVILVGLLGAGLAIALVTALGLAIFAENQGRTSMPMMQGNTWSMMAGDMDQQQMMKGNMGSMMNMMSMNDMMQGMMGNSMNTMSMQEMMEQMMGSNYVHMGMYMFMPSDMRTTAGATITWQNHSNLIHNVVGVYKTDAGDTISVRSPDLSHMDSWSYTFSEPGTFEYFCSYHESEGMQGKVVVSS